MYFFNQMAKELRIGRNNRQCRSHHQKMMKKYGGVESIILNLTQTSIEDFNLLSKEENLAQKENNIQNSDQELILGFKSSEGIIN